MESIFIVMRLDYEDSENLGAFSTKEEAKNAIYNLSNMGYRVSKASCPDHYLVGYNNTILWDFNFFIQEISFGKNIQM